MQDLTIALYRPRPGGTSFHSQASGAEGQQRPHAALVTSGHAAEAREMAAKALTLVGARGGRAIGASCERDYAMSSNVNDQQQRILTALKRRAAAGQIDRRGSSTWRRQSASSRRSPWHWRIR